MYEYYKPVIPLLAFVAIAHQQPNKTFAIAQTLLKYVLVGTCRMLKKKNLVVGYIHHLVKGNKTQSDSVVPLCTRAHITTNKIS